MSGMDHPIRRGAILRLESESENVEPIISVEQRLQVVDEGHYYYELCCPTLTGYYSYHQEDVEDLFSDTGITHEGVEHSRKPIEDDRVQELYESLCDHSWHAVHDPETMEKDGFVCSGCRARRDKPPAVSTTGTDQPGESDDDE
jgi:hypothetical protein